MFKSGLILFANILCLFIFQTADATSIEGVLASSSFTFSGPISMTAITASSVTVAQADISTAAITYIAGSPSWLNNGKILKMSEFSNTGADVVTSAATFTDTNLTSGSYTPISSTSDIWVVVVQAFRPDYSNTTSPIVCDVRLLKDSTTLRTWTNAAVGRANPAIATSAFVQFPFVGAYLDTAHSASARTYKTQFQDSSAAGSCRSNSSAFGSYMYIVEYEPKT